MIGQLSFKLEMSLMQNFLVILKNWNLDAHSKTLV